MEKIVSTESLQYVVALINAVKDSPLGMLALLCLVLGLLFYLASVYSHGFNRLSFFAYVLTLAFFGLIVLAVYHTSGAAKMIYYAGRSGALFNVGRFTRLSDTAWQDSSIVSAENPNVGYTYHFVKPEYQAGGRTLLLQADPNERQGSVEIDFDSGTIWWNDSDGKVKLYQIVVTM